MSPHKIFRPTSGRAPTRPTRPRRRAPSRIDRYLSVLPEGRDVQHARVRGKEPHDIENSLSRLSNSAVFRIVHTLSTHKIFRLTSRRAPTRATRRRRRAPPQRGRNLSVLPAGRDAQHARARINESRDSEFSLSTLSYRAAAYSRSTLRKRSSDSVMKTRSDNSTARALKVPSSEAQAVECAGEGRERGARRRWQEGEGVSLNRPSPAVYEGADQAPARRKLRRSWRRKIILHRAMVRCGRAHASTRTNKCRVSPAQTIARWPRPTRAEAAGWRMGWRRRSARFPVPAIRYQRARVQLACT